jgi:tripartite-type tricarboxylate transporter receptor subunit TctC
MVSSKRRAPFGLRSPQRRRIMGIGAGMVGSSALGLAKFAHAQANATWPTRSVRVVVPFSPGGTADILGRVISQPLSKQLGQPFVVENKPGAGGTIGTAEVARAAADGYTMLVVTPSYVITNYLYPDLPFDGTRDLFPLGLVMTTPLVVAVNPALKLRTPAEFILYAKANPGQLTFSSSGTGSTPHLAAELLKQQAGIDMLHIPYKGGGDALTAVLGGSVSCYFSAPIEVGEYLKTGKLVAVAVTSAKRTPRLPDTPTLDESGVRGYEVMHYTALMLKTGTPKNIVDLLSSQYQRMLHSPDVTARIVDSGGDVPMGTIDEAAELFNRENVRWARVIKTANLKL